MQKKIIALAVAGLVSGAAFAQSNVQIYGIVDAAYVNADTKGQDFNGIVAGGLSGSRLGFKGTEDLGNGLKAVFVLEYGLNNDINEGIAITGAGARQQYVGLSNSMGTVSLGRQYAPGFGMTAANDAFAGAAVSPAAVLQGGVGSMFSPTGHARWNNAVNYASPSFGGLTVQAIYGFGQTNETDTSTTDRDGRLALGATYANGPMRFDAGYSRDDNNAVQNNKHTTEWFTGGSYNFGVAKLVGSYQRANDHATTGTDYRIWNLGVVVPVGSGNIHASYADLSKDGARNDSDSWAIGYTHSLSKRTTLYTTYTNVDNEAGAALGPIVKAAGKDNDTFALGVRHSF